MTLREHLPTWLGGKRAATNPMPFHQTTAQTFGPGIGNQPTHDALLKSNVGVVDMGTRAIANRVSTLNPQVKTAHRDRLGTLVDEILDDHPLKSLLDRPHPDFSRSMLLRLTAQWIVTVGEAYWLKVGSRLSVPMELHPIPPANIFPVLASGVVSGYRVRTSDGKETPLDRDKVVRFYFPDPANMHGSEGYIGPNAAAVDSYAFAGQHLRSHYEDDATPKMVLKALEGAEGWTADQKDAFYTMWRQHYHARLGNRKGIPAILPTNYDLVTMAVQSGADIVPLLEHWRDDQLMGMGVPRSILGQVVSGDRSSAETNQYVFDLHTVQPIATLIAEGITLQLAPDFDASLFVEFEEFVSGDKRFVLEQETADLTGKVRSINHVREDRGLDPVEWGEEPVGKIGEAPYTGDDFTFEPDDAAALGGDESEDEEDEERGRWRDARHLLRAAHFAPEAEWKRQLAREKAYVPSFLRAMRSIFRDQLASVLKKLKEQEPRSRAPSVSSIFNPDEWVDLFERRVEPIRLKAFEAILGETLVGLGVDTFVFTDEMRLVLRRQGAQLVQIANATTEKMIAKQLQIASQIEVGVGEGEGIDQIAKRIKGVFAERRKNHARTIARTEILGASQEAQLAGFEIADVPGKQWNDSMDDAVRDSHRSIAEPIVGRDELFILNDGEAALAPKVGAGHAPLSAGNSINCRCFVTPVLEE